MIIISTILLKKINKKNKIYIVSIKIVKQKLQISFLDMIIFNNNIQINHINNSLKNKTFNQYQILTLKIISKKHPNFLKVQNIIVNNFLDACKNKN